jgi:hypothetical protein
MFNVLNVLSKCVLILMGAAAFFAFITFSPMIFCHGGGSGGNCGEGLLASLPLALLLTPVVVIFGTIYFFRSTKKPLLSVLALGAVAMIVPTAIGHVGAFAVQEYRWSHPTKEMKDDALLSYTDCLRGNARAWPHRRDDDSAIERWSLERCSKGRKAFLDQFPNDAGTVAIAEREFQINLPLMIESGKYSR